MLIKESTIILAHGSRNAQARNSFLKMVEVIKARLKGNVVPAFFSLGEPHLPSVVSELVNAGFSEITIFPYFLFDGNHIRKDIPAIIGELEEQYPHVKFNVLKSLEHEPLMPEIVVENIWQHAAAQKYLPGPDIEISSLDFIRKMLGKKFSSDQIEIVARVVHSTADFSLGHSIRFHEHAIEAGLAGLHSGKQVICDVTMVKNALTGCTNVLCAIEQPGAGQKAVNEKTTRSAAGMELMAERIEDSIVVVGNAPTALWKVLELAQELGIVPALIVGVPVGFVGAAQSKQALMSSGLVYISNHGPKGGSPAAGAIINALLRISDTKHQQSPGKAS